MVMALVALSLSVGALNSALNALLIVIHGVVVLAMEHTYLLAAKVQLHLMGATAATDSSEVHVSHWLRMMGGRLWRQRVRGAGQGRPGWANDDARGKGADLELTSNVGDAASEYLPGSPRPDVSSRYTYSTSYRVTMAWSFALLVSILLLIPAELVLEGGLSESNRCAQHVVTPQRGICASPWEGVRDSDVIASALLTSRIPWADPDWTVVPEGASMDMNAVEVRSPPVDDPLPTKVVAAACRVSLRPCTEVFGGCGNITFEMSEGQRGIYVINSSLAKWQESSAKARFVHGDFTHDTALGVGFAFWPLDPPSGSRPSLPPSLATNGMEGGAPQPPRRIWAAALEMVVSDEEVQIGMRMVAEGNTRWDLPVTASRARIYNLSCLSSGLVDRDLTRAASLWRTMQMSSPGTVQSHVGSNISRLAAITPNDLARALFALKAEDVSSVCVAPVRVYDKCGQFNFRHAIPLTILVVVLLGIWAVALWAAWDLPPDVRVPIDAAGWRRVVLQERGSPAGPGDDAGAAVAVEAAAATAKAKAAGSSPTWGGVAVEISEAFPLRLASGRATGGVAAFGGAGGGGGGDRNDAGGHGRCVRDGDRDCDHDRDRGRRRGRDASGSCGQSPAADNSSSSSSRVLPLPRAILDVVASGDGGGGDGGGDAAKHRRDWGTELAGRRMVVASPVTNGAVYLTFSPKPSAVERGDFGGGR